MADWRDVMEARGDADRALSDVDAYGSTVEDNGGGDGALAALLAARALCKEIRAHSVTMDCITERER